MKRAPDHPTVSVIIPTRNRAAWLCRALTSVQQQSFQDFEILVVDDASTDHTPAVVRRMKDPRIRYFRQSDIGGAAKARNVGIRAARGRFIGFLDDDDEWLPEKLEKQLRTFSTAPEAVGVVYSGAFKVSDRSGTTVAASTPSRVFAYVDFLKSTRFNTSVPLIRKACFDTVGLFDETLPGTQDRDLWLRMARQYAFDYVPDLLVKQHIHGAQITTDLKAKIDAREKILHKYWDDLVQHPDILVAHLWRLGMLYCVDERTARGCRSLLRALRYKPVEPGLYRDLFWSIVTPRKHRHRLLERRFANVDGIPLYY